MSCAFQKMSFLYSRVNSNLSCQIYPALLKVSEKVKVQDLWFIFIVNPPYDAFSSYYGYLKIYQNVKVCTKIHNMLSSHHMIITHHLKKLWFPRYFCTPSGLDTHCIWWWKVIICWKVTMGWKVIINLQYKKHDEVSSYDVIPSSYDNEPSFCFPINYSIALFGICDTSNNLP